MVYEIKITGSGTKENIAIALQEVINGLIDVEEKATFEDATLCTEIKSVD